MDYDQLAYDLQHSSGIRLLKADHAALIISFLHRQFKREQRVSIPLAELVERLEQEVESMSENERKQYPRPALAYLTEWADEQHHFIRITTPGNSDKPHVGLTADTERTISWLEEQHAQPFVGAESRFLYIVQLLREIVHKSTEDPLLRLQQLEQQRDLIQQQIDLILETETVDDRYTSTQLKERFFETCRVARELLRDFRLVEERFREMARTLQQAQLQPNMQKGSLVAYVLDADTELKSSDQGRSFYTFLNFLMAPSQQDELAALLDAVRQQADLQPVIHEGGVLRHLTAHLLEAGEKVVQSTARMAEQLRRLLDEQAVTERRRIRELVLEIKQQALRLGQEIPGDTFFITLDGPPEVHLVIEHGLWEPTETLKLTTQLINASHENLNGSDLASLYNQFFVDRQALHQHIEKLLETRHEVTLAEVLNYYPPKKGLSEVLAYYAFASSHQDHLIDANQSEVIVLPVTGIQEATIKSVVMPRVVYRRRPYGEE